MEREIDISANEAIYNECLIYVDYYGIAWSRPLNELHHYDQGTNKWVPFKQPDQTIGYNWSAMSPELSESCKIWSDAYRDALTLQEFLDGVL